MTTRKIGDEFEKDVMKWLSMISDKFHYTGNSGATFSDGDIRHVDYVGECKVKSSSSGCTIPGKELKKLIKLADKQLKEWLFFVQNKEGKIMVTMEIGTFVSIAKRGIDVI